MKNRLVLTDDLLFAKGTGREIYNHPFDSSKIVKISITKKIYKNQNFIDNIYFNYLLKHNIPMSNIAKCHGYVDTNLGKGLVFTKIVDYNAEVSKTFNQVIQNKTISENTILKLFREIEEYISTNKILYIDTNFENIVCCEYEKDKYKLIIIDGLGGTNILRFFLMLWFDIYAKYKLQKAKNIMLNELKKYNIKI